MNLNRESVGSDQNHLDDWLGWLCVNIQYHATYDIPSNEKSIKIKIAKP